MNDETLKIYIDKRWISGDTCLFNLVNTPDYLGTKLKLSKMRKQFVERLQAEGLNIIFDKKETDDDTIYFIMDDTALGDKNMSIEEYQKKFHQSIQEGAGECFHYPHSLSIDNYLENPFFPAVFKNTLTNGGEDKFLIENSEQVEILKAFYTKFQNHPTYKDAFDCTILQQYLENPGKYASYLRVLIGASTDVLGASLKYSSKVPAKPTLNGLFEKVFLTPESEYFLNSPKMFNYYAGGGSISFHQPRYSDEKAAVLRNHGFDLENLELPDEVLEVSRNIMRNCHQQIGVLCGIDFMLNEADGKWYYLENQAFPAIDEWAHEKGIRVPSAPNAKGYLKYLELDLDARYEALMRLVHQKEKKENKTLLLKK